MSRFEEVINEAIDEVMLGEAFKAETLAAHIAERVRDRQEGMRAEVTHRGALSRAQAGAGVGLGDAGDLHAAGLGRGIGARHAHADRRGGAGDDGLPVRAGAGDRALARPARARTGSPRTRSSGCWPPCRWPPTTSAASAACTWAAPRAATRASRPRRLLRIVESSMSSEIYELMKRADEVEVVEKAHMHPRFVEDCVREMVRMAVDGVRRPGRRRLPARPPGEPGDDPSPQRGGGALWPAGRARAAS